MSREAFAATLSWLVAWPVKPGMIRAWESGVPVPPDIMEACRTGGVPDASHASARAGVCGTGGGLSPRCQGCGCAFLPPPRAHLAPDDIADFTRWITATNTSDEAIEHIERVADALAEMHTEVPDRKVLADVMQLAPHSATIAARWSAEIAAEARADSPGRRCSCSCECPA